MIWRFRARREFDRLAAEGRRVRAVREHAGAPSSPTTLPLLWCTYLPDAEAIPPRVAFAVGRTFGNAVARNRLRRRLRAVLVQKSASGSMPAGWYLFGVRRHESSPSSRAARSIEQTYEHLTFDRLEDECDALLAGARQVSAVPA